MEVIEIKTAPVAPGGWDELVATAAPALLRLALMLTGTRADAEDLLQATFARSCRHGRRIVAMEAPMAYLRRVMLNEHTSSHRARRVRTTSLDDFPDSASSDHTQEPADVVGDRDEVWRWLATLPRQQRAVLVLRFYEDLPDQEIADLLGCGRATVRSHASHGLAALRALLAAEESR